MTRKPTRLRRGGAREGAGRPRAVHDPVRVVVDVERPDVKALRAISEKTGASVSWLVREAIRRFVHQAKA